jgi:hypothetical protein
VVVYIAMSFLLRVEAITHTSLELVGTVTGWSPYSHRVEPRNMIQE